MEREEKDLKRKEPKGSRWQSAPKVELHCHLDGSLSRAFVESRLGRRGVRPGTAGGAGLPEPSPISGKV